MCWESRNSASDLELSQLSAHVDHSNRTAEFRSNPHREFLWLWTHLLPRCAFQNTGTWIHQEWLNCLSFPEIPNIHCFMVSSNYLVWKGAKVHLIIKFPCKKNLILVKWSTAAWGRFLCNSKPLRDSKSPRRTEFLHENSWGSDALLGRWARRRVGELTGL